MPLGAPSPAAQSVCIISPMTKDLEQLRGEVERLVYSVNDHEL